MFRKKKRNKEISMLKLVVSCCFNSTVDICMPWAERSDPSWCVDKMNIRTLRTPHMTIPYVLEPYFDHNTSLLQKWVIQQNYPKLQFCTLGGTWTWWSIPRQFTHLEVSVLTCFVTSMTCQIMVWNEPHKVCISSPHGAGRLQPCQEQWKIRVICSDLTRPHHRWW